MIFGAYNRSEFSDPELAVANMVTMLAQYPAAVMTEACNPRTGIQARSKWPPKLSELRDECERVAGEFAACERRELLAKHRVLIDTPFGPRPEAEVEKASQEARDRAVSHWENEVRPTLKQPPKPSADEPPPGLTDDQRREWFERRLEALKAMSRPALSAELRKKLNLPEATTEAA